MGINTETILSILNFFMGFFRKLLDAGILEL